ncbi:uncharacterized protein L203_106081 [Cryptococcus depauperatus CBS 7841]|uniref:Uncharacterized protein n=1 Tax=Cryptococcus depauperatus CBS 7841 TaxID=1295531 RepID=A0A1E3IXU1_9TREE|nr:NAD+ kinase [Cryptococcus depauperatus CBS 7841]
MSARYNRSTIPGSDQKPVPYINIPTATRTRHPVPQSPLSKYEPTAPEDLTAISPLSLPDHESRTAPTASSTSVSHASPCFIHSHLNRHGSLQDKLKHKTSELSGATNSGPAVSSSHEQGQHYQGNATKPIHKSTKLPISPRLHASQSHPASPKDKDSRVASRRNLAVFGGYDSDQSSSNGHVTKTSNGVPNGSARFIEDLLTGDEEDNASLTKQLAQTAQGVREMSKELSRTKVRSNIQHVLIVTKARDNRLIKLTRKLALYLMHKRPSASSDGAAGNRPGNGNGRHRGMVVYVDAQLRTSKRFDVAGIQREHPHLFAPTARRRSSSSASSGTLSHLSSAFPSTMSIGDIAKQASNEGQLRFWTSDLCSEFPRLFDFVITLGGDGTVLFTSWLFQRIVPPVLPFALGSLGFLTNFDFYKYKQTIDKVVDEGIRVNLRMRFTCIVYRAIAPEESAVSKGKKHKAIKKPGGEILMSRVDKGGWESLEGPTSDLPPCNFEGQDKEIMCYSTRPVEQFEVLNDLVVDRGPSPYVSLLELFGDEHHLTTVQADGLTVSTPTGSTAYSLSAGGSLVHPQIPTILITPICPHTLSFRPMLLPDSMELRVCVPYNSRSTAWASFDGRGRVELRQGDHIKVTASKYPFPTVCADKASTDWFSSISRTLRWNEREKQKSFVVVEEMREPPRSKPSTAKENESILNEDKASATFKRDAREAGDKVISADAEEDEGNIDEEEDEEDDDSDDGDDDEVYDIDDKSGPSSPPAQQLQQADNQVLLHKHQNFLSSRQCHDGLETPNRFATPYAAPPAISQRHLIQALTKVELREKENEEGQRDNIREGSSALRCTAAPHLIPAGRSTLDSSSIADLTSEAGANKMEGEVPKPSHHHHTHHHTHRSSKKDKLPNIPTHLAEKVKSKAFAFFGQDDSASDASDDHSEEF